MNKIQLSEMNYKIILDWSDVKLSTFDVAFEKMWKDKMNAGIFKYKLESLKSKFLEGNFRFFAQLNIKRVTHRRPPQPMFCINQPFDKEAFNFTKIKKNEFMFQVIHEKQGNEDKSDNYIAINDRPLEFGHSLLLPSLFECHPQLLTQSSIQFAVDVLLSSFNPAFRIAFNSLCAYASVNHLHLHAYYLNQPMLLETIEVEHLSGNCYILEKHASKGFAFEIMSGTDIGKIIKDIYILCCLLVENNFAHNIYMTRGLSFKRALDKISTSERDCIRIYIWPRTHSSIFKIVDEFNPAACELFGHLLVKTDEAYHQLTEDYVVELLGSITDGPFAVTKNKVSVLFEKSGS